MICIVAVCHQAHNQLGTLGGAKSFLRGAQILETMSNKFFQGGEKFSTGGFATPVYGPVCQCEALPRGFSDRNNICTKKLNYMELG